jgi:hypothetical protein
MRCIYCLRTKDEPPTKEHVFPHSIFGDHDELVLAHGEVCADCNNRLGRLESAFKDRLGLIPLLVGPGRNKRGRPTSVNMPGIRATRDPRNPLISVNTGKLPAVFESGHRVMPALKPDERVEFEHRSHGPEGFRFSIKHGIKVDEVFVRVLTNIAFETVSLHRGADYCADLRWHRVRAFILRSEGERTYAMPKEINLGPSPDGWVHPQVGVSISSVKHDAGEEWLAGVKVGPAFLVDLSAGNWLLADFVRSAPAEYREWLIVKTCSGKRTPLSPAA